MKCRNSYRTHSIQDTEIHLNGQRVFHILTIRHTWVSCGFVLKFEGYTIAQHSQISISVKNGEV